MDDYTKQLEEQIEKLEEKLKEAYKISEGEYEVLQMVHEHYKKSMYIKDGEDIWMPSLGTVNITIDAIRVARLLKIKPFDKNDESLAPYIKIDVSDWREKNFLTRIWKWIESKFDRLIGPGPDR